MDTDKEIANLCRNIYRLRRDKGLTQKEMAAILGIGVGSLHKIEKGILPPRITIQFLLNLYDVFHILPSKLLEEDKEVDASIFQTQKTSHSP